MTEQASDEAMVERLRAEGIDVSSYWWGPADDRKQVIEVNVLKQDTTAWLELTPTEARGLATWLLREAAAVETAPEQATEETV